MDKTKITVRVPHELINKAKQFAKQNNTTLTSLIETYLQQLPGQSDLANTPIVQRLTGGLSTEVSIDDYHKHIEEKYGQ